MLLIICLAVPFHALTLWMFGCYRGIWRYASIPDLIRIIKSVVAGCPRDFPRRLPVRTPAGRAALGAGAVSDLAGAWAWVAAACCTACSRIAG